MRSCMMHVVRRIICVANRLGVKYLAGAVSVLWRRYRHVRGEASTRRRQGGLYQVATVRPGSKVLSAHLREIEDVAGGKRSRHEIASNMAIDANEVVRVVSMSNWVLRLTSYIASWGDAAPEPFVLVPNEARAKLNTTPTHLPSVPSPSPSPICPLLVSHHPPPTHLH
jgi:hypothetical protein